MLHHLRGTKQGKVGRSLGIILDVEYMGFEWQGGRTGSHSSETEDDMIVSPDRYPLFRRI